MDLENAFNQIESSWYSVMCYTSDSFVLFVPEKIPIREEFKCRVHVEAVGCPVDMAAFHVDGGSVCATQGTRGRSPERHGRQRPPAECEYIRSKPCLPPLSTEDSCGMDHPSRQMLLLAGSHFLHPLTSAHANCRRN